MPLADGEMQPLPDASSEMTRHLAALIRLDTSNPPGNEALVTGYLAHELERDGIEHQELESAPGRANLVARVRGTGELPPVMLLAHADVVGADPEGWQHPPFSGEVVDGAVWGRGALDMKGHIASHLQLLRTLVRRRSRLRSDVVLVVTADEEAGSHLGAHWLWEKHRNLLEADVAFNEGGGQRFMTPAGPVYTMEIAEKGVARIELRAQGTGGHASIPRANNAVFHLAAALHRLAQWQPTPIITAAGRRLLQALAATHPETAAHELEALLAAPSPGAADELPIDPVLRDFVVAGLHNTAVPSMLSASPRLNVAPTTAVATLDARLLPGQDPHEWAGVLQRVVGDSVEVHLVRGRSGVEVSVDDDVINVIDDVLGGMDPGAHVLPYVSSASSDARALPGMQVLGFFPSHSDADRMRMLHGVSEHVDVSDLLFGHTCLLRTIDRLRGQA